MLKTIKDIIKGIKDFLLCLITSNCEYSLTKFLAYFFTMLIFYLVIFTDKDYYQLLIFLGVLLGVRHYDKKNYYENTVEVDDTKRVIGFVNKNNEEKG